MKHWRWKLFRFFPAKSLWIISHHHTGPIDFGIVSQQSRHIVPHSFLQLLRGAHCLLDIIVDIGGKGHLVPDVGISGQVKCLYFEVQVPSSIFDILLSLNFWHAADSFEGEAE